MKNSKGGCHFGRIPLYFLGLENYPPSLSNSPIRVSFYVLQNTDSPH